MKLVLYQKNLDAYSPAGNARRLAIASKTQKRDPSVNICLVRQNRLAGFGIKLHTPIPANIEFSKSRLSQRTRAASGASSARIKDKTNFLKHPAKLIEA